MVRPLPRQSGSARHHRFYRTLALMTRDAIRAMRDELAEYEQDDEAGDEEA